APTQVAFEHGSSSLTRSFVNPRSSVTTLNISKSEVAENIHEGLRDDKGYLSIHPGASVITPAQSKELRKKIGATAYIECSSKTQQNEGCEVMDGEGENILDRIN
ncbi:uncharacterized protein A4U43_C07F8140, partial [Asparagus officinalis]